MTDSIRISQVKFTAASSQDARRGLLGWVSCNVNQTLCLDGLSLRKTRGDRLAIGFPGRRSITGTQHQYIRPLNDEARRDIECQIFEALGLKDAAAR